MRDPIIIFPNRNQLYLYTGAVFLLFLVSILVMLNLEEVMHRDLRVLALILGFLGTTVFGYGLVYNVFRLRSNKPLIQAGPDGLSFHSSALNQGRLKWEAIREYGLVKHGTRKVALIYLHKPQAFMRDQKGLQARIFRSNMKRYQTPIALPASLFPEDPVEVLKALSTYTTM